tara:strand:+ start:472 stop:699 length:228 start_codon:yes stop_codon:yes gene_type:complete
VEAEVVEEVLAAPHFTLTEVQVDQVVAVVVIVRHTLDVVEQEILPQQLQIKVLLVEVDQVAPLTMVQVAEAVQPQ